MTFKLPELPSLRAEMHELADFAEILAWKQNSISEREIIAFLGRVDENAHNEGVNDDEEDATNLLPQVMIEIQRREAACKGGYPFSLTREGTVLRYNESDENLTASISYRYLLLSTRLNMMASKVHAGLDGTLLLEFLAAHVLRCYLGQRSKSFVFGSAEAGSFANKVVDLCHQLNEGSGFEPLDNKASVNAVDDKLDAVAWIPFNDETPGQLIIFGQCKTGTNWKNLETQLQPTVFAKRWLKSRAFLVDPIRAFCIAEAIDRSRWNHVSAAAGIVFDRCRIVDFCEGFDATQIRNWTDAAFKSISIGGLAM